MTIRDKKDILEVLKSDSAQAAEQLFAEARKQRQANTGDKIFLYGFVYFSTFCRNNCSFCYFRNANSIQRYRKSMEEILTIASGLSESGVNLLDLTMGEDAAFTADHCALLCEAVKKVKVLTGAPVMVSPGVVAPEDIDRLAEAGADWYALYQETHNRALFARLRIDQSYDVRMEAKRRARRSGMLVEEGIMTGIGESAEDIADSILEMGRIGASQMRSMSFIPQQGSPMEDMQTPDRMLELKIIAILRILYPHVLIPATLDVDGIKGLESRILAGANVVTSIIPPKSGCAGVAQKSMDIDEGGRTAKEAKEILQTMGLRGAETDEYVSYLNDLKKR